MRVSEAHDDACRSHTQLNSQCCGSPKREQRGLEAGDALVQQVHAVPRHPLRRPGGTEQSRADRVSSSDQLTTSSHRAYPERWSLRQSM